MTEDEMVEQTGHRLRSWAALLDVNTVAFSSWVSMKGINTHLDSGTLPQIEQLSMRYPDVPGAPFHIFAASTMAHLEQFEEPFQIDVILFRLVSNLPPIRVTWVRGQEGHPVDVMMDPDDELCRVARLCLSVIPRGIPLPDLTDYQTVGFYSDALGGTEFSPN
jgi:hypothetical protein